MATVTITITDKEDGHVGITAEFDPPVSAKDNATVTGAQWYGIKLMKALAENFDEDGEVVGAEIGMADEMDEE